MQRYGIALPLVTFVSHVNHIGAFKMNDAISIRVAIGYLENVNLLTVQVKRNGVVIQRAERKLGPREEEQRQVSIP